MTTERVIWTSLPNHVDEDGRLRLSVFVAPRLLNDNPQDPTMRTLADFAQFLDWPAAIGAMTFTVQIDGGPTFSGLVPEQELDSELWKRIFPGSTPVVPFQFEDYAKRNYHVFPVRPVLDFLQSSYGAVAAANGTDPPPIDDKQGPLLTNFLPLESIVGRVRDTESFQGELDGAQLAGDGQVIKESFGAPGSNEEAMFQAYRFYYRPGSRRDDLPDVEDSPEPPRMDFHERVAFLSDHGGLLRRLGLVLDLAFERTDQIPADGVVRVKPDGPVLPAGPPPPRTRFLFEGRFFGAKPRQSFESAEGLLRLSEEHYDLYQVDVDGAAMKAVDFGQTLARQIGGRTQATPDTATVPALRSGGLSVARTGRGEHLLGALTHSRGLNGDFEADADALLDAEDLVRGFRVDVMDTDADGGKRWFSLHRRIANYRVDGPEGGGAEISFVEEDEGYLKGVAMTTEREDHVNPTRDVYLHEAMFGWDGWSLSVPRPGKRIVEPGEGDDGSSIRAYDPQEDNPLGVVIEASVAPRSLPRLRFGHRYRMRARTVDLAGNSLPFSPEDLSDELDLMTEEQRYQRFEPVPSPTVLRHAIDTEAESLERLAIRSNFDRTPAEYVAQPEVLQALVDAAADHEYREDSQRHIAPPKGSQMMAEQAGKFEPAFGGDPNGSLTQLRVALREEGTFLDEAVVDLATGLKTLAIAGQTLYPTTASLPGQRGAGLGQGEYVYFTGDELLLPYLPDPMAIGIAIVGYDRSGNEVFQQAVDFPGSWPELEPFRVRLTEGGLDAAFENGVLEVRLPKAEFVRARISSRFASDDLDKMAVKGWMDPFLANDAERVAAEKAARDGRNWMLTPFRWMTFTHAVQQPLEVPDSEKMRTVRFPGESWALFVGPIRNHAKSTGRLDVMAKWTEDVDLVTEDAPRMRATGTEVHKAAHAVGFDIDPDEDVAATTSFVAGGVERVSKQDFGDTKYRKVTYHAVATTRFREYFPTTITDDPPRIQRVENVIGGDGEPLEEHVHHVLSTARPAAPEVLYTVPTFEWERGDPDAPTVTNVRKGRGVRVYLGRPWFSSGDGELLGVVMRNPPRRLVPTHVLDASRPILSARPFDGGVGFRPSSAVDRTVLSRVATAEESQRFSPRRRRPLAELLGNLGDDPLKSYVTGWGSDPLWKSAPISSTPLVSHFPRHASYGNALTLDELPSNYSVTVAGHEVAYDTERKLWYCDIDVHPGSTYFPFIQLALARYQPHSLNDAHLSRVVMADFIQIAPDREASVTVTGQRASVTVRGFSGRNIVADLRANAALPGVEGLGRSIAPNTRVQVQLERRESTDRSDLEWEPVGPPVVLKPSGNGSEVEWSGSARVSESALGTGTHRLLVTEWEEYVRTEMEPGDPTALQSPADLTRERIVYADIFPL